MPKPTTSSNRTRIEINTANIKNLKEDLGEIREQVVNHIPTALKQLDDKIDELAIKLAGLVAVVGIILKYFLK